MLCAGGGEWLAQEWYVAFTCWEEACVVVVVEGNVNLGTSQSGDDTPSGMVTLAKLAAEW